MYQAKLPKKINFANKIQGKSSKRQDIKEVSQKSGPSEVSELFQNQLLHFIGQRGVKKF